MNSVWIYSILSAFIVSLISLIGVITLSIKIEKLRKVLVYLVAFSAGAFLGGAFLHLLPELVEEGFEFISPIFILSGIILFFIVEKFVHWHHCHNLECKHLKSFAFMNLIGDGVHNFLDGLIIAGSYLISIPLGFATTLAVIFHEIPQEIGDFGVLIHGGFSRIKALTWNLLSGLIAILGVIFALILNNFIHDLEHFLVPFAIGGFIYIAVADLIPELHKEVGLKKGLLQLLALLLGLFAMGALLFLEVGH